jgi:hypothetical protein
MKTYNLNSAQYPMKTFVRGTLRYYFLVISGSDVERGGTDSGQGVDAFVAGLKRSWKSFDEG